MKEIRPNNNEMRAITMRLKSCLLVLNFRIEKSMFASMVTFYFERMIKAWIVSQYVMKVDT